MTTINDIIQEWPIVNKSWEVLMDGQDIEVVKKYSGWKLEEGSGYARRYIKGEEAAGYIWSIDSMSEIPLPIIIDPWNRSFKLNCILSNSYGVRIQYTTVSGVVVYCCNGDDVRSVLNILEYGY